VENAGGADDIQIMFDQIDQLRVQLDKVNCLQAQVKGFEGDDIIYTYTEYVKKWGGEAVVVSSDKDFYQVIGPSVKVYDAMTKEVYTEERFLMEFGFPPSLWVDVGAFVGEVGISKDDIFGVDGWGLVMANKYVKEHGGVEAVIAAVQAKEKKSKKEQTLMDSIPRVRLAKSLKQMDIVPNLPRPRMCRPTDVNEIRALFYEFGMVSLLKEAERLI
jgi:DNA polymerase-1